MKRGCILAVALLSLHIPRFCQADTFGSGTTSFEIDFVKIGNSGNPADNTGLPNPAGSVSYEYRIGKYEISRSMIEKANTAGNLGITLADMTAYGGNAPDKPATGVSWFDAARFVNYLNISTNHALAYKFDGANNFQLWAPGDPGYDPNNLFRNANAFYFLPSMNEWYKAAFYDPLNSIYYDFPTASNGTPTPVAGGTLAGTAVFNQSLSTGPAEIMQAGGLSPYGTMAQGGNAGEWVETAFDRTNDNPIENRAGRGGGWETSGSGLSVNGVGAGAPTLESFGNGFRVVSGIPEPTTFLLLVCGLIAAFALRGRVRKAN